MDDPNSNHNGLAAFKRFLEEFCRDVEEPASEENDSPVRHVSYMLEPSEIEGESLRWALDYLNKTQVCPPGLGERISREAFRCAVHNDLHDLEPFLHNQGQGLSKDGPQSSTVPRVEIRRLQRLIEVEVYKVATRWNHQLPMFVRHPPPPPPPLCVSVHAIKNSRRRMEDRHVILTDLNTLFELKDRPRLSYFAVFDGHGGPEAAMFAASQLHLNLLRDPCFHDDPEAALKRAYSQTDRQFSRKAEEMKLNCGTTGVSVLLRGEDCFVSWLGDSQVMLVRDGRAVTLMDPHKPDREDEQQRIEALGGFVANCGGVWRVRGNISVSRAIGDVNEKPYLSSDADVKAFPLTGSEDYLVLACDGIWDVLDPADIPFLVHTFLSLNPSHHAHVARHLVSRARELRSTDNISCLVVFLRESVAPPIGVPLDRLNLALENGEETASEVSWRSQPLSSKASTASGSTGISVVNCGGNGVEGEVGLYSPRRQIVSDFPHKLERQTGFFFPGNGAAAVRSLRTGHHRQQLVPLAEDRASRAGGVIINAEFIKDDQPPLQQIPPKIKPLKNGSKKSSSSTTSHKRKSKQKKSRRRGMLRTDSPDSSAVDSLMDDASLASSNFAPTRSLDTFAKHTSLAEILQQMVEHGEGGESAPSMQQEFLSVRGTSAHLHNTLPRIPSRAPSNLLTSTTAMTPVSSSRHAQAKGRSRP